MILNEFKTILSRSIGKVVKSENSIGIFILLDLTEGNVFQYYGFIQKV